jgi:uncharacterized protein with HEPN domain
LALIHSKALSANHLNTIFKVADLRNSYIHHKYNQTDVDDWDVQRENLFAALKNAEKTVKYLKRFEFDHFFDSKTKKIVFRLRKMRREGLRAMRRFVNSTPNG